MEYRRLGRTGLQVPVFSYGTATFGGGGEFFKAWGATDVKEAKRLIDICMDSGLNFFDTANVYSRGLSEEILGQAIEGRRAQMLLSTKATFPMGDGANERGSSRQHLTAALNASLKRLKTDYVDMYFMHGWDAHTPVAETLDTLNGFVQSGKVRYVGCSNFPSWHLMKSLAYADQHGLARYAAHQAYYSLVGRELEFEHIPFALDQGVGTMVWSPLAGGALSGKIRRDKPAPKDSRLGQINFVKYNDETLFNVVDVLDSIGKERGKTVAQVALNWILRKPTIANIVVGARNEEQLKANLGALDWKLTNEEVGLLDKASAPVIPYPNWHQKDFPSLIPSLPSVTQ